jgi:GNAT superfamily N-acetyltransferase
VHVRAFTEADRERAERLSVDYLGRPLGTELAFVAVEDDGRVVGVCFGETRDGDSVTLAGIAVEASRWRLGIGTALLAAFEGASVRVRARRITVGSAEGFVERFYENKGYHPIEYVVRSAGRSTRVRVPVYTEEEKQRVRGRASADVAYVVFEKRL